MCAGALISVPFAVFAIKKANEDHLKIVIGVLTLSMGADISEGSGSRVRIKLNGVRAVFHRPHPNKETDKGALMSMRRFLENAGVSG